MTLRMPQYGDANVGFLADALPKLEGTTADDAAAKVAVTAEKIAAGRTLTGKSGHGCISCHDISGVSGGGTRGPDLALTDQRVRYDWYLRWMNHPQRIAPGTKMPQVAIDGKSLLTNVYDGDADRQFEALWAYLALGPGLPLPAGMEPPKGLVVQVKDRPEILRTFMPDGAGTKAIAVGYAGGTNVVFDAATCRLGYAWTGNFLDASPVWNNRGGNPAKLLGPKFWTGPPGFPWAATESRTPPDFAQRATDPAFGYQLPNDEFAPGPRLVRFAGYALDPAGVPTFRYALTTAGGKTELAVRERIEPLPVTVAAGFRRTLAVEIPAGRTTWFLAGVAAREPRGIGPDGAKLTLDPKGTDEAPAAGSRLVVPTDGGKATVIEVAAVPTGTAWRLAPKSGGGWQVLLRLPEGAAKAELVLHVWGLPRDDDELVNGLRAK
jgi:mono/diheme cytochrome c family protein